MYLLCASMFGVAAWRTSGAVAFSLGQLRLRSVSLVRLSRLATSTIDTTGLDGTSILLQRRRTCVREREAMPTMGRLAAASSSSSSGGGGGGGSGGRVADPDVPAIGKIVTVCGETESEETIKKSRFIGRCGPAATFEEGKALLTRVLQEHPKARHSCWAWRGRGDDHRFSDDGEPGGTAGQPILGGIESEGVSEVMVVVTRYSGGIKLGTGGLCRAYGGASRLCLQAAERETRTPVATLSVTAPVGSVGGVYHAVSDCQRLSEEFTANGSVVLRVSVELAQVGDLRQRLQDATKGAAEIFEEESRPGD